MWMRETSSCARRRRGRARASARPLPPPGGDLAPGRWRRGFTLVELALVISILGIVAAIAAPRFFTRTAFEEPFFVQDVLSGLRYAQKLAVASGCDVQVSFTPAGSYTLLQRTACRAGAFAQAVPHPGTGEPAYTGAAPAGTVLASTVDPIIFDALGRARNGGLVVSDASVTVGATVLSVVGDTGFSFDPAS